MTISYVSTNAIAEYRQAKGLTLEEFGALVGVQKSAVSKWENGRGPSPGQCVKIEAATSGEIARWQLRPDLWDAPNAVDAEHERAS